MRIDTRTRDVRVGGRRIHLSQKEYELLVQLAREPERVFTKEELLYEVWDYRAPARTTDARLARLAPSPQAPRGGDGRCLIENVWGVGYRLLGELPEM